MNYRHAFHAGNFADVVKHIVLMRVIEHLKRKDKPFRFIDTHAGIGIYDIGGPEAERSGEWQGGIGRLYSFEKLAPIMLPDEDDLARLIEPYFTAIGDLNRAQRFNEAGSPSKYYPGAGELARRLMRVDDRIVLNELHVDDAAILRANMRRDERVRTLELDGWTSVRSLLPPKERRGVLLLDPPFETAGEFTRLHEALLSAAKRFASGVTIIWYPIKAGGADQTFRKHIAASGLNRLLSVEFLIRHRDTPQGLNGCGLIIHNPPFGLDGQLARLLPWLCSTLSDASGATADVAQLVGE